MRVFEEMKRKGSSPNQITYSSVIEALFEDEEEKQALTVLKIALNDGMYDDCFQMEKNLPKLDLHNLSVFIARTMIRHFLMKLGWEPAMSEGNVESENIAVVKKTVIIVTGQGHHVNSDGSQGVLRDEIAPFITQELQLDATVPRENPGRLRVTVPVRTQKEG